MISKIWYNKYMKPIRSYLFYWNTNRIIEMCKTLWMIIVGIHSIACVYHIYQLITRNRSRPLSQIE